RRARSPRGAGGEGRSYDVVLTDEIAAREARVRQCGDIERRLAARDELGDRLARGRRVHEPMTAEPGGANEARDAIDVTEDRMFVGRVFVEARPSGLHVRLLEQGHPVERALDDRRDEVPVDGIVEA